jgi:hypothetical protein
LGPGGPPGAAGGAGSGSNADRAKRQAAFRKCGINFRGGAGQFRNSPAARQAYVKFAACVRKNGYNLPAPNTSGNGPVFNRSQVNQNNPKFIAASRKCQNLLPRRPNPAPGTNQPPGTNQWLNSDHRPAGHARGACRLRGGACGYDLFRLLSRMGVACDVIPPSLVFASAGDRVKTDRCDVESSRSQTRLV